MVDSNQTLLEYARSLNHEYICKTYNIVDTSIVEYSIEYEDILSDKEVKDYIITYYACHKRIPYNYELKNLFDELVRQFGI